MSTIEKLAEYFTQFPGIGPRQAKRFVYFLLTRNHRFLDELSELLLSLKKEVVTCESCHRFFSGNTTISLCTICADTNRAGSTLMIVARDVDFENVERSGVYEGRYFILGGTVPILEKKPEQKVRSWKLKVLVEEKAKNELKEIILAFAVTPEGENTIQYLSELLTPAVQKHNLKLSTLGRGLSTGTELEYPDTETIKNALQNRA